MSVISEINPITTQQQIGTNWAFKIMYLCLTLFFFILSCWKALSSFQYNDCLSVPWIGTIFCNIAPFVECFHSVNIMQNKSYKVQLILYTLFVIDFVELQTCNFSKAKRTIFFFLHFTYYKFGHSWHSKLNINITTSNKTKFFYTRTSNIKSHLLNVIAFSPFFRVNFSYFYPSFFL